MLKKCMGCMEDYDEDLEVCPYCGYIEGTKPQIAYHIYPGEVLVYRYTIGRVLGYGSFGVTYLGWDNLLEKKVAIKEYLPSEFATRAEGTSEVTVFDGEKAKQFTIGKDKFSDEAKRLAAFNKSKGIVVVYDQFEDNGTSYIVMDYFEGETLQEKINREGAIPYQAAVELVLPILNSLQEVHEAGIIHRDISPDNIYITKSGEVKLLDFGAARYASTNMSKSLSAIYKQGYAPYEQYQSSKEQGPWSDVYALAATMYYMITGIVPQESMNRLSKEDDHLVPPRKIVKDIPKNLNNALMNALIVYPKQRTQSIQELKKEIEDVRTEIKKTTYPKKFMIPKWAKLTASAATSLLIAVCLLITFGFIDLSSLLGDNSKKFLNENETYIPGVFNMDLNDAEETAEDSEIVLQIVDKVESDKVEVNRIMMQDPMPGVITTKGGLVNIVISKGEKEEIVPDLTYERKNSAISQLELLGFNVKIKEEVDDYFAEGTVIKQSAKANGKYAVGGTITLTIAKKGKKLTGDGIVGDYINQDINKVVALLNKQGLYAVVTERKFDSSIPKNCIMSQSVPSKTKLEAGSCVEFVVSKGIETIIVPDIQYMTYEKAKSTLESLGFIVVKKESKSDIVQAGKVISQSVKASTSSQKGQKITLTVSLGSGKLTAAKDKTNEYNNSIVGSNPKPDNPKPEKPKPQAPAKPSVAKEWSDWTTDSSKANNSKYLVEKKTQYRSRKVTKETTTQDNNATKSGWQMYKSETYNTYGSWSGWSTTKVTESSTRQVQTKVEKYQSGTERQFNYSHWLYWNNGQLWYTWSETRARRYGGWYEERGWSTLELYLGTLYDGQVYGTATAPIWFYEKTRDQPIYSNRTLYRSRSINKNTRYYFQRTVYGNWTTWQDAKLNPSDSYEVETRTVYRYKEK